MEFQALREPVAPLSYSTAIAPERVRLPERVLLWADSHRWWLFGAVLGLYLLGFNGQWRVERDSALYLSVARSLAEGQHYTYHGQAHHLAFPGLPLLLAGTFKVFGSENLLFPLVVMLLMGLAVLGLTYRLFLLNSGRPTAVVVTTLLGASRLFYRYSFELMSDMPFLVGVMAFLVGYEGLIGKRRAKERFSWFDAMLLVIGLAVAIAMRPAMWILLAAIVLAVAWGALRGEIGWRQMTAVCAVVLAGAIVFYHFDFRRQGTAAAPQYEDYLLNAKFAKFQPMLRQMVHQNIPELFEAAAAKALFGCPIGPGFNSLACFVVLGLCAWLLVYRPLWGLWSLLTVGMLFLFKPLDRYLLPIIPLLVFAWWKLLVWLDHKLPGRWGDRLFLFLLIGCIGTNLARLGEMVVEQRRTPFLNHYHDGRYASLADARQLLEAHTQPGDWVLVEYKWARVITWLTRRYAFEPGDREFIRKLGTPKFAMDGGPGEEGKSRTPVDPRAEQPIRKALATRGLQLGPALGQTSKGPYDRQPWTLYGVRQQ